MITSETNVENIARAIRGTRVRASLVEKFWNKETADKFRAAMEGRNPDESQEALRAILRGEIVLSRLRSSPSR